MTELKGSEMLDIYKDAIADNLIPSQVMPHLVHFLEASKQHEVLTTESSSGPKAASLKLVEALKQSTYCGWYQGFLQALQSAEFFLILEILKGHVDVLNQKIFKNLLKVFWENLVKDLHPDELLPHLVQSQCLTSADEEEIVALTNTSRRKGCWKLLSHVATKNPDWFQHFMSALKETGYEHLANEIEPQFDSVDSGKVVEKIVEAQTETGKNTTPNVYVSAPDEIPESSADSDYEEAAEEAYPSVYDDVDGVSIETVQTFSAESSSTCRVCKQTWCLTCLNHGAILPDEIVKASLVLNKSISEEPPALPPKGLKKRNTHSASDLYTLPYDTDHHLTNIDNIWSGGCETKKNSEVVDGNDSFISLRCRWQAPSSPGYSRREHASVNISTSGSQSVPDITHLPYWMSDNIAEVKGKVWCNLCGKKFHRSVMEGSKELKIPECRCDTTFEDDKKLDSVPKRPPRTKVNKLEKSSQNPPSEGSGNTVITYICPTCGWSVSLGSINCPMGHNFERPRKKHKRVPLPPDRGENQLRGKPITEDESSEWTQKQVASDSCEETQKSDKDMLFSIPTSPEVENIMKFYNI